ncbi:MAG: metallophosphoesterase [Ilumatobacteraceae bacterium]
MTTLRIGVAGDWHGNRTWALRCVAAFADAGIGEIFHLGDFGIWPGPNGQQYLLDLEAVLASHAMTMFVTPGNHEDYDQIGELTVLDLGHDVGAVQWITDHIALLPRGHRWMRNGWSFVSLGGAPSIDRWSRRKGIDWWEAEAITDEDVARVVEGGRADVMLAHDAPDAALGTPRVASILRSNPMGWPVYALNYAAEGKARITTAFLAVEPRLFVHGHFHVQDEAWVEQFDHPTHVVSLNCDGAPTGNLVVVTLPDRVSGGEPAIEWLAVLANKRRGEFPDDGVAPKAPMTEWTVYDVVGVLNNGRSVHWKALARVARRDGSPFGSMLAEALVLTSNQLARDYVHRWLTTR